MSKYTYARFPGTHTVHIVMEWRDSTGPDHILYCAESRRRADDPVILSESEAREVSAIEICPNCQKKVDPPKPQKREGSWRSEPATQMQCDTLRRRLSYTESMLQGLTRGAAADIINPMGGNVGFVVLDPKNARVGRVAEAAGVQKHNEPMPLLGFRGKA